MAHFASRQSKPNQTGSGLFHSIVKEQNIPGQLEGLRTNANYSDWMLACQARFGSIRISSLQWAVEICLFNGEAKGRRSEHAIFVSIRKCDVL
jgi:hypothetical protein